MLPCAFLGRGRYRAKDKDTREPEKERVGPINYKRFDVLLRIYENLQ